MSKSDVNVEFMMLSDERLAFVVGGADPGYAPDDNARGRVGPGTRWKWLGNYYTPEALVHDNAVRGAKTNGSNAFMAHFGALPLLPGAATSYFRARFSPGPNDKHLPD
jgi:hypothetical protein